MKVRVNILIITIVLTIIVFGISTHIQKKLINYEATSLCLVLTRDINEDEQVQKSDFKSVKIPISLVATQRVVKDFNELEGLYAKDNIKSGQIAYKSQFDTKESLSIYESEVGKEKISIKVKAAENGMSFQIKEKSRVNVYATLRNEYANGFLDNKEKYTIGNEFDGYTIIKILDNVEVLGIFTADGEKLELADGENLDSILVSVNPEEAKQINLIRELATFNITGLSKSKKLEMKISGDGN